MLLNQLIKLHLSDKPDIVGTQNYHKIQITIKNIYNYFKNIKKYFNNKKSIKTYKDIKEISEVLLEYNDNIENQYDTYTKHSTKENFLVNPLTYGRIIRKWLTIIPNEYYEEEYKKFCNNNVFYLSKGHACQYITR